MFLIGNEESGRGFRSDAEIFLQSAIPSGSAGAEPYDAEYVALAQILGCRLVTLDGPLRRGADRLGFVVSPAEL
jgi:predicted nucleic acid-binding protein